ncbi:MAG: SAM-dependent methyltransferase, partial [Myxococcota bacterium]
ALYEAVEDETYLDTATPRRLQMRWLLDEVGRLRPDAKTGLDIGAAAGLLVAEGRDRGLDIVGVEPSRAFCAAAENNFGVRLLNGVYPHPELAGRRFDVVFLVDVIEHVADPLQLLRDAASALAPGGLLVCVTPDLESVAARVLGPRWWHFRLAHVGYFSRRSFLVAAARADLRVTLSKRAQWFFPVDYLVDRVAQYLPVSSLVAAARRLPAVGRLVQAAEKRVIPLDLKDSWVFFAASSSEDSAK